MMGIRSIGPERYNGFKALLAAFFLIKGTDIIRTFLFRHPFFDKSGGFFHAGVIDAGGFSHFFLFIFILDGAYLVHTRGGVYITYSGIAFHQVEEEARRPAFINPHIGSGIHMGSYNANAVVRIGHPDFRYVNVRNDEKIVQKEDVFPVGADVEDKKPFVGLNPYAGKVSDA